MTKLPLLTLIGLLLPGILGASSPSTTSPPLVFMGKWHVTAVADSVGMIFMPRELIRSVLDAKIDFGQKILLNGKEPCKNPKFLDTPQNEQAFVISGPDPMSPVDEDLHDISQKCPLSSGKRWTSAIAKSLKEYEIACDGEPMRIFPLMYFVLDEKTMFAVVGRDYACLRKF